MLANFRLKIGGGGGASLGKNLSEIPLPSQIDMVIP